MPNYDKTDLLSTLNYIKSEYGTACFKDGKIIAYLSDLAPSLKREKSLLKRLVDKGLMKEIAENATSDDTTQRRIIFKTKTFLVEEECLQEDFAVTNINTLIKVFNYNASLQQKSQESKTNSVQEFIDDETVKCGSCGREVPKDSRFCRFCGNNVSVITTVKCYNCGKELPIGSMFCDMCGNRLSVQTDSSQYSSSSTNISQTNNNSDLFQSILDSLKSAIGLEMVYCPAGSFMMGSPENELGRFNNEIQHKVTLSKPFYIGKYPVTQKLYEAVMGNNPSYFEGENNPVECVSWDDAKAFCDKLNKVFALQLPIGYRFDLPTEAQWEYACRAGTTTALNNCKDLISESGSCYNLDEVAWYSANSDNKTHPVGQKKPNAWGIFDMHGNVWEWFRDLYGDYPKGNVIDPVGPSTGSERVIRGGSWDDFAGCCRSACRGAKFRGFRYNYLGFRLVLVPNS